MVFLYVSFYEGHDLMVATVLAYCSLPVMDA